MPLSEAIKASPAVVEAPPPPVMGPYLNEAEDLLREYLTLFPTARGKHTDFREKVKTHLNSVTFWF